MHRSALWGLIALGFLVAACTSSRALSTPATPAASGGEASATPTAPVDTATAERATRDSTAVVIATGAFDLPAASAFGTPGFHEVLRPADPIRVPAGFSSGGPLQLVLSLRDTSRPGQTCSNDHPLSGCATVDWSDSPTRPKVPSSGVFDNSVTIELKSGPLKLFLSESGALQERPVRFDPG